MVQSTRDFHIVNAKVFTEHRFIAVTSCVYSIERGHLLQVLYNSACLITPCVLAEGPREAVLIASGWVGLDLFAMCSINHLYKYY